MASRPRLPDAGLLEILTRPREAGTPAAGLARDAVAAELRRLGYQVELQPFRFDPASLRAFPLAGAGLIGLGLILLPLLVLGAVPPWGALVAWIVGATILLLLAFRLGATAPTGWQAEDGSGRERDAREGHRTGRLRNDANLLATRSPAVRWWIVAHLDTKAQGHSMAGRLVAVWLVLAAALVLTGLGLARLAGPLPLVPAAAGTLLGVVAGCLATRGRLVGQSPGVRDNGSGVVAALAAAAASDDPGLGIAITGAEEFGLAGARVLARSRADRFAGRTVINLDTLDETGPLRVVIHDQAGAAAAVVPAGRLSGLGIPVTTGRLPPGILVDSLVLARAGAAALTVARLDWSTLRRLHTARDSAEGCGFETAARVGAALVT